MPQNQEEALFALALEKPAAKRAVFLDAMCEGNPALRQRLEVLLAAHDQPDDLAPKGKPAVAATIKLDMSEAPDEAVGQTLGRYKLMERLGEGGCGVVYVAEQTEPVRRRVALKVIKLGMDTKAVVARFEAERQALAMMDHPNIAKVLDAGTTEVGRPFFVMELVRGIRITDYCDQNQLSTKERLELFIKICQAIQHAHQKGIIHRDIKPSNILVTLHDGVPVPKVIDFGIAKATEGRLTDATVYTQLHQFIGTPAYMSPEQAEMSGLDIDTRSDIYSLGVLLYELLAGSTPFDAKELMASGIDGMRKTIREQEPMRPSTRFATLKGDDLTTTAKRRSADKSKLMHDLKGDLDWIVMKCLEKDRTRRYDTATGLAADIKRHLNNEPVVARPPSAGYRIQKAIRRNKISFAAGTVVFGALLLGIIATTWQSMRATHAKREAVAAQANEAQLRQQAEADEQTAKTESAKNEQTAQFLLDMLNSVGPSVALGRDTTLLREMMDQAERRMSKDLADNPVVEAKLRGHLGWIYYQLGEFSRAEDSLRRCVELCRKGSEKDTANHDWQKGLGDALHPLALTLWHESKLPEAESCQRESLAIRRKLLGDESREAAQSLADLALVLRTQGKLAEAEEMFRESLATRRKLLGNENEDVAWSLFGLGLTVENRGRLAEAESFIRKSQATFQNLFGPKRPEVALTLIFVGEIQQEQGKLTEAESALREALAMQKELLPKNHADTKLSLFLLPVVLEQQGKLDEAVALYRQAADAGVGPAQASLGRLYASGRGVPKDMAEAAKWYRKAIENIRPNADNGKASSMINLARLLATCDVPELRDGPGAVGYGEKVVAVTDRVDPRALDALAAAYAETGQFEKAVVTQKEAIAALTSEQNRRPFAAQLKRYEAKTPTRDSDTTADQSFTP
jgi:serine/threonine protein kinase/tetratricopeptide (TPR) repeat protein